MTNMQQALLGKQYLKTQVQTASREQLVLMLYDGIIRFAEQGKEHMAAKEYELMHKTLTRCEDIIMELLNSLDRERGGVIADSLAKLYGWCLQCLVEGNLLRSPQHIDNCTDVIRELREAWATAMEKIRAGEATDIDPAALAATAQKTVEKTELTSEQVPSASNSALSRPAAYGTSGSATTYGRPNPQLAALAALRQKSNIMAAENSSQKIADLSASTDSAVATTNATGDVVADSAFADDVEVAEVVDDDEIAVVAEIETPTENAANLETNPAAFNNTTGSIPKLNRPLNNLYGAVNLARRNSTPPPASENGSLISVQG